MTRVRRWIGITAGLVVLAVLLAAGVGYAMSERLLRERHTVDAPPFTLVLPTDSASLVEGERIARTRGCQGCHGEDLGGKVFFSEPNVADLIAPNLTALIPQRSDADLERALRHGVRPDGTALFVMPAEMYRSLSDADLARLLAWLRTVPPVEGEARTRHVGPMGRLGLLLGMFRTSVHYVQTESVLPAPTDSALRLGHYIATTACTECHGNAMQGDGEGSPAVPPILAAYSTAEFAAFVRTGIAKGGRDLPMMSGVARQRLVHLRPDEVESLYAYLISLNPGS